MKHFLFTLCWFIVPSFSLSQTFFIPANLPPILQANAGKDTTIIEGSSCILGAMPSAFDGYGQYQYLWSPSTGLDDPTKSNPIASPALTTIYQLTVTDANHCISMDEVQVGVTASGISKDLVPLSMMVFPNPSNGIVRLLVEGGAGKASLKAINVLGQLISIKEILLPITTLIEVDVRQWHKGWYHIVIETNIETLTKVLVVL